MQWLKKKGANFDLPLPGGFDLVTVGLWSFNKITMIKQKTKQKYISTPMTVLMILLTRNFPTCAYIDKNLRKWKMH